MQASRDSGLVAMPATNTINSCLKFIAMSDDKCFYGYGTIYSCYMTHRIKKHLVCGFISVKTEC